ncbi:MAG: hypothetical protein WC326_09135 [Candidatus Delongbacteria bacterium]
MILSARWLRFRAGAFRRLSLVLALVLLTAGCGKPKAPAGDWPLGFHLDMPAAFQATSLVRPNGEATLYLLSGDEPDLARLTVRKRLRRLELLDHLAEELDLGGTPLLLEEGETFDVKAVNAEGLGRTLLIQPFPLMDSTLVLLYDVRVFNRGAFAWTFIWQQEPADSAGYRDYQTRLQGLIFQEDSAELPEAEPAEESDSLDAPAGATP